MKENREPGNRPTQIQSNDFWERSKGNSVEKGSGIQATGYCKKKKKNLAKL